MRMICIAVFSCLLFGCAEKHEIRPSGLAFEPDHFSVQGQVPGVYKYSTRLVNKGSQAVKRIQVRQTCGCIEIPNLKGFSTLAPGEGVTVEFTLTETNAHEVKQAIYAWPGFEQKSAAKLRIDGTLLEPFHAQKGDAPMLFDRLIAGARLSPQSADIRVVPGLKALRVTSGMDWLDVSFDQSGGLLKLALKPKRGAPDFHGDIPLNMVYKRGAITGEYRFVYPLEIRSHFTMDRSNLWFGRLRPGEKVTRKVVIRGNEAASKIAISKVPAGFSFRTIPESPHVVTIQCQWVAPYKTGYVSEDVALAVDGKELGNLRISALIAQ